MASPAERSKRYRDRLRGGPARVPKPHGTMAAYRRHERAQEPPCQACKQAHAEYQRALYANRKARASGA
jgi:hypothetical protein